MKDPLDLINKKYNSFRASEKRVAEFVQNNAQEVITLSLQNLANKCATSDATVLRFCRSLGYFGFSDFKTAMVTVLLRHGRKTIQEIDPQLDPQDKKGALFQNMVERLESTISNCDYTNIRIIADRLIEADKILIIGLGGSAGVAHILCDSLGSVGLYSTCPTDPSIIHNLVSVLNGNDVLIGISYSGETEEIISSVNNANEHGAFTVGITNFSPSPLAEISDVSLVTSIPDVQLGGYSCQARIAQLALLEFVLYELYERIAQRHVAK